MFFFPLKIRKVQVKKPFRQSCNAIAVPSLPQLPDAIAGFPVSSICTSIYPVTYCRVLDTSQAQSLAVTKCVIPLSRWEMIWLSKVTILQQDFIKVLSMAGADHYCVIFLPARHYWSFKLPCTSSNKEDIEISFFPFTLQILWFKAQATSKGECCCRAWAEQGSQRSPRAVLLLDNDTAANLLLGVLRSIMFAWATTPLDARHFTLVLH